MRTTVIGRSASGDVLLDLERLVETRMLIQAGSGAGKSWTLRRVLEQTAGQIQQIIIDPEGEFSTLREKFDYIICSPQGGDAVANPATAKLLARRLLEIGVSAILDIYELKAHERQEFVQKFLNALVNAPKKLWHPVLVILDEAHVYCLDEETEVLTINGWRKHDNLSVGDQVAGYDMGTQTYHYESISRVITGDNEGPAILLESDGISCLSTPDHRAVIHRIQRAKGRYKIYDPVFCEAKKVPQHVYVPIGGLPEGNGVDGISNEMCRILGWVITDGYRTNGEYIQIEQSVATRKQGVVIVNEMDKVFNKYDGTSRYERKPRKGGFSYKIKSSKSINYYLGVKLSGAIIGILGDDIHQIPRDLIINGNVEQCQALFRGLMEGDGTATGRNWRAFYPGKNEQLADRFQEICLRLGISSVKKFIEQQGQYHVLLSRRQRHYIRKPKNTEYRGIVWDITIPSGAFVARRRGKIFVTGNCPQHGGAVSASSVIDIATRGRKRGYGLIVATQRLSKLHKDVAAEMLNKLIGRTGLDIDVKRASDELGLNYKDALKILRELHPGEFYAFGPAIANEITLLEVGDVMTSHPMTGQKALEAPPLPSARMKTILSKLVDLPKEALEEARTISGLQAQVKTLSGENATLKRVGGVPEPEVVKREQAAAAESRRTALATRVSEKEIEDIKWQSFNEGIASVEPSGPYRLALERMVKEASAVLSTKSSSGVAKQPPDQPTPERDHAPKAAVRGRVAGAQPAPPPVESNGDTKIPAGGIRILKALCTSYPGGYTKSQTGVLSGFSPRGGTFSNYISILRRAAFIEQKNGLFFATVDGLLFLGDDVPSAPATHEEAMALWSPPRIPAGAFKMLTAVVDAGDQGLDREAIAIMVEMASSGGTFSNYLSILRRNGLIIETNKVSVASSVLYPVVQ